MQVRALVDTLKASPSPGEIVADQIPGLFNLARRYLRMETGDVTEVEDLVMAGVRGVLEVLRVNPSAPRSYLFGAGRRAMSMEVRRMVWHRKFRFTDSPIHVEMTERLEPTGHVERVEASAQLALIQRKARRFDWEVGLRTWLEEHTLQEATTMFNRSQTVLCERRAHLRLV